MDAGEGWEVTFVHTQNAPMGARCLGGCLQPTMVGQACWHPPIVSSNPFNPVAARPCVQPIVAVQINRQLLKHSQSGNCECRRGAAGGPCAATAHQLQCMGS